MEMLEIKVGNIREGKSMIYNVYTTSKISDCSENQNDWSGLATFGGLKKVLCEMS